MSDAQSSPFINYARYHWETVTAGNVILHVANVFESDYLKRPDCLKDGHLQTRRLTIQPDGAALAIPSGETEPRFVCGRCGYHFIVSETGEQWEI